MPVESVNIRVAHMHIDEMSKKELRFLLNAIVDAMAALGAKMDADAGITDTNYAATMNAILRKN